MNILKLLILISLFLASQWACGAYPGTDADFAVLPPYCKARLRKDASYEVWNRRLGPDFLHVHHYCAGLHTRNIGDKFYTSHIGDKLRSNNGREEHYTTAIGEMGYVLTHASPTFKLLPKIYYDQGQMYETLGKTVEAMQVYQQSIKLNPKLPMPYAALSDLFKKQKNNKEAIMILEQGLKYKPTSKALLKRMEKLTKDK